MSSAKGALCWREDEWLSCTSAFSKMLSFSKHLVCVSSLKNRNEKQNFTGCRFHAWIGILPAFPRPDGVFLWSTD